MIRDTHTHTVRRWLITDKGDQEVRLLADRHYSRRTVGDRQFTRNGQNLVFVTPDDKAAWVTFRPTEGKASRQDGLDAWECALFRNEGPYMSSELIREATALTTALWGLHPKDGLITYVKSSAVKTEMKGFCYLAARWKLVGQAADGKPMFRAPRPTKVDLWQEWQFKGERGGKLRRELLGG